MNRRIRNVLLAIVALLFVGAVKIQPAKAAVQVIYSDNFEGTPETRWSCETYFPATFCYPHVNSSGAHSGTVMGQLLVGGNSSIWVGIGKAITLTPPAGTTRATSCQAQLYVKSGSQPYNAPGQFEIINPPNWTYITTRPFNFAGNNYSWIAMTTSWFTPPSGSIYVRLVAKGNSLTGVYLYPDDLTVTCNFS